MKTVFCCAPFLLFHPRSEIGANNLNLKSMKENVEQQRLDAVMAFLQHGTYKQAARAVSRSEKFVFGAVQKAKNGETLRDRPRSGRPPKMTPHGKRRAMTLLKRRKTGSLRKTASRLRTEGVDVHFTTVGRHVRSSLVFRVPRRVPIISKKNQGRRMAFAKSHSRNKWRTTLFTDEKLFGDPLDGKKRPRGRWVPKGSTPCVHTRQKAFKLMVWGGISWKGKTKLHFVEGKLNQWSYSDLCRTVYVPEGRKLFGRNGWTFMQDNATPHVALHTRRSLSKMVSVLPNWPAQSPDLNPIENVWCWMESELQLLPPATSATMLRKHLQAVWDRLDLDRIRNLIKSVPTRLKQVIRLQGGHTNY